MTSVAPHGSGTYQHGLGNDWFTPQVSTTGLVQAARRGDDDAWRTLVERFTPRMWAATRGFSLNPASRADAVQAAWSALAEHLERVREPEALGGWLMVTVRRACLAEIFRSSRVDVEEDVGRWDVDPQPSPEERAAVTDRDARLWRAVGRLPARDRQLLVMLTCPAPADYQQIAAALGIRMGSIGPTRARCLRRLRAELAAEGIVGLDATG